MIVAPCAGAGIETVRIFRLFGYQVSRPLRGGGD